MVLQAILPVVIYWVTAIIADFDKPPIDIYVLKPVLLNQCAQMALAFAFPIGTGVASDADLWKLPVALVLLDLLFFLVHACFHAFQFLYRFHRMHHELAPSSMRGGEALYTTLVDHVFVNLVPLALAAHLAQLSYTATIVFYCFAAHNTVVVHFDTNSFHAEHHRHPCRNLGLCGLLTDRLRLAQLTHTGKLFYR